MDKNKPSRVIIAGTNSGCGKTTITCALISALVQKGIETSSFKCGPDYIDPMFHGKILGVASSNLDPFFYDENTLNSLLCENAKDVSVIEGVMGFYDGMMINSTKASTYDVAKITKSPVILAINCKGSAYSILPVIEGFTNHKKDYNLAGVILNNITKMTYSSIKKLIEEYFENKIAVLGYLPKLKEDLIIESRHLGLVTADEIENIKEKLKELGKIAEETLDIEKIIEISKTAEEISTEKIQVEKICEDINIAVAYDKAFCFYYKDSFSLFEKMGAKITFFSPTDDEHLPENIDGLYLGGGYPELYLDKLSQNITMKEDIKKYLENGGACIAECGGFMYLTQEIENHEMVGYIKAKCHNTKKLSRFGYVTLQAKNDNIICKKGEEFKAHEFHYYDSSENGSSFIAKKMSGKSWDAVISNENLYAGYPHISFYSNIKIAKNFINRCREIKNGKSKKC